MGRIMRTPPPLHKFPEPLEAIVRQSATRVEHECDDGRFTCVACEVVGDRAQQGNGPHPVDHRLGERSPSRVPAQHRELGVAVFGRSSPSMRF